MSQFKEHIRKKINVELQKELGIKNKMAIPSVTKININVGIGKIYNINKDFSDVINNITLITGQKPVVKNSKKAISNFKLREGMPSGIVCTLRDERMNDFLNKLINVIFPRMKDFRGLSLKSFDGNGNYNIGIKEFLIFPEIKSDDLVRNHGIQITIVTSAEDDETSKKLLTKLGFPFKKETVKNK